MPDLAGLQRCHMPPCDQMVPTKMARSIYSLNNAASRKPMVRKSPSFVRSLQHSTLTVSRRGSELSSLDGENSIRSGDHSPFYYTPTNLSRCEANTNKPSVNASSEDEYEVVAFSSPLWSDIDAGDEFDPSPCCSSEEHIRGDMNESIGYSDLRSPFKFKDISDRCAANIFTPYRNRRSSVPTISRNLSNSTSPFTWDQTSRNSPFDLGPPPRAESPAHSAPHGSDLQARLPGCIFDYEDPWDVIGTIMGLPPNHAEKKTLEEELAALGVTEFRIETAAVDSDNGFLGSPDESTSSSMCSSENVSQPGYDAHRGMYNKWSMSPDEGQNVTSLRLKEPSSSWMGSEYTDLVGSGDEYSAGGSYLSGVLDKSIDEITNQISDIRETGPSRGPHAENPSTKSPSYVSFTEIDVIVNGPNSTEPDPHSDHQLAPLPVPLGDREHSTLSHTEDNDTTTHLQRNMEAPLLPICSPSRPVPDSILHFAGGEYHGPCLFDDSDNENA